MAGNGKTAKFLPEVESRLRSDGIAYQGFFTNSDAFADKIVAKYLDHTFTDLLIVGGDGTFHEAINGLPRFDLSVSVIQTGTGNDFIKAIDKKANPRSMLEKAILATPKPIDLGLCNKRLFHNGVGIGFDGSVAHRSAELKAEQKGSVLSYYRAIAEGIFKFKGFDFEFYGDDFRMEKPTFMITIANGVAFGGGMMVTPFAKVDDELFDVCHVARVSVLGRLWRLPFLVAGKHSKLPKVNYFKSGSITVNCAQEATAHIDGEIFKAKHFHISMAKEKLLLRY